MCIVLGGVKILWSESGFTVPSSMIGKTGKKCSYVGVNSENFIVSKTENLMFLNMCCFLQLSFIKIKLLFKWLAKLYV